MKKEKSYLILLLSIAIIFGLNIIYDFKKPNCADAQACVSIKPYVIYRNTGTSPRQWDGGGCDSYSASHFIGPIWGTPWVALTGWDLEYTSADHHIDDINVEISSISISGQNVTFTVSACLSDNNDDDDFRWVAYYVIVGWI